MTCVPININSTSSGQLTNHLSEIALPTSINLFRYSSVPATSTLLCILPFRTLRMFVSKYAVKCGNRNSADNCLFHAHCLCFLNFVAKAIWANPSRSEQISVTLDKPLQPKRCKYQPALVMTSSHCRRYFDASKKFVCKNWRKFSFLLSNFGALNYSPFQCFE